MDASRRLTRNSIANVVRGASAGLAAIILPAVLVRTLPGAAYSAWALILQIAAYIAMLDLGLQVGIARFIARETARADDVRRQHFFFAGLTLLGACAVIGLAASLLLALLLPSLFPSVSPALIPDSRLAIVIIGSSCALALPGAAIAAVFIGLERYEIPAVVLGVGRLTQVGIACAVAYSTHDIVKIAIAYALGNVAIQAAYLVLLFKIGPRLEWKRRRSERGALSELVRYAANLSIWNFSMLLVYGLDTAIVAEVDYKALAPYSICANLMAVLIGFIGSTFNVLISRSSALDGQDLHSEVGQLLIDASRVSTRLLIGLGLLAVLAAPAFLSLWIGPRMGAMALPYFWVLLAANGVRLFLAPYSTILMGTGEHKWATVTTLTEGVTNLIASVVLGRMFGAIGVAYGTLIGAFVGIGMALLFTFPRASRIDCDRRKYLAEGFLAPAICFLPAVIGAVLYRQSPSREMGWLVVLGSFVTAYLLIRKHPYLAGIGRRTLGGTP